MSIIVDTGSSEKTVEISNTFLAIIKTFEWHNDFAEAQSYALSFATKEWLLVIDANQHLRLKDYELFIVSINNEAVDSYYIKTLNFTEVNKGESCMINLNHRLFKKHKGYHYTGAIHEQLQCSSS